MGGLIVLRRYVDSSTSACAQHLLKLMVASASSIIRRGLRFQTSSVPIIDARDARTHVKLERTEIVEIANNDVQTLLGDALEKPGLAMYRKRLSDLGYDAESLPLLKASEVEEM